MRKGLSPLGNNSSTGSGKTPAGSVPAIRLGIVASRPVDPWDVAVFPALERFEITSVILGRPGEENPIPVSRIETLRDIAPWRRVRALERLGLSLHGFARSHRLLFPPSPFTFDDAVVGLADRIRSFDVLLAFETYSASTYQVCRRHPAAVVKVTENITDNPPQVAYRWLKGAVRRTAARFACVSESARDAMLQEGFPGERISVIPECVDTERFRPQEDDGGRGDTFRIGFAGKLDDAHGFSLLLEAFVRLEADASVRLAVAGDGPLLPWFRALTERQGLAHRVEYVGRLPYHRMPEFLRSVDVLCVPCREVPGWRPQFGVVNIEAMACGKPIVATRVGATPEIVPPGLQPYLVPSMDMRALLAAVRALVEDPALCSRLGSEAREWVRTRYDVGRVARQWSSLITEVADASRHA